MLVNTKEFVIKIISESFLPLGTYLNSSDDFIYFMYRMGWKVNSIPSPIDNLSSSIATLSNYVEVLNNGNATDADYQNTLTAFLSLVSDIDDLGNQDFSNISTLPTNFSSIYPEQLKNFLICTYFEDNYGLFYAALSLIGIFQRDYTIESFSKTNYYLYTINWNIIANIILNPLDNIRSLYNWSSSGSNNYKGIYNISLLLENMSFPFSIQQMDYSFLRNIEEDNSISEDVTKEVLNGLFFFNVAGETIYNAGIGFHPLPAKSDASAGIAFFVFGNCVYNQRTQLFPNHYLQFASTFDFTNSIAIIIRAGEAIKFLYNLENTTNDSLSGELSIKFSVEPNDESSILLFGDSNGTNISYKLLALSIGGQLRSADYGDLFIELAISGATFTLKSDGSDSFIQNILPSNGITANFSFLIGFSLLKGFYFNGGGGLDIKIPNHIKIGPVTLENVNIIASPSSGSLPIIASADITTDISGLSITVNNIGISGTFSFPESGGNLGPINFDLDFKPPTGAAISIAADPVSGGGFLNFDEATSTYTGALSLKFSQVSFNALGIIVTKLPGGQPGYSMLGLISALFTPAIQLGMGFTLSGLGGIIGLNRTVNPDALRAAIKDNTLDNVLFPDNPMANANKIISSLGQLFPVQEGQFLIGPMAKISWGTPAMLDIRMAVVIEMPNPVRLAILGVLNTLLPQADSKVLQINVNFAGIIDFTNKYLAFDAGIYDSKLLTFALTGDMCLRLYWGSSPNFLLSVGGFHPKYTPPPLNLPQMKRIAIILVDKSKLKITAQAYFAVTSNTAQFGARVDAMAKAWKISAVGAVWFDVLFQFSPFHFTADMGAMFAVKMGSKTILSIYVDLTLDGPNPYRAKGSGKFKILFVKVTVHFDATFGQASVANVSATALLDPFTAALNAPDNWQAVLPQRNSQQISWFEQSSTDTELSVDPAGVLQFSQKLLPMDIDLQKFGSSQISDYIRFTLSGASGGGLSLALSDIQDNFARSEFFNMTDDQKLSSPSYELFNSGVSIGSDALYGKYVVAREVEYEDIFIDSGYRKQNPRFLLMDNAFRAGIFGNYISRSSASSFNRIPDSNGPVRTAMDSSGNDFVLVNRNDLTQAYAGTFSNSVEAQAVLDQNRISQPNVAADWIIANVFELG